MIHRKVVIVGGVAGGASCAARLRRLDEQAEITVYERSEYVSFASCGLPYYIGDVIVDESKLLVASPKLFDARFRVDVRTRVEALSIDREKKTIQVKNLDSGETREESYDTLVLSPGAKPIRPPIPGIDAEGIFCLRSIPDSRAIREFIESRQVTRAVVIGAGFIGLEMSENLAGRGIHITLVEGLPQVLAPIDPEMAEDAHQVLRDHGVDLVLGDPVQSFGNAENGDIVVQTKAGRCIETSMVILGIGVVPDTELAKEAGLELGVRGAIKVNEFMQTSDPNIYAVGDAVTSKHFVTDQEVNVPLAGPANRQGRVAADNIVRPRSSFFRGVQGTAVCGLFGSVFACTGANEKALRAGGIAYEKVYVHPPDHASYYPGAKNMHLKVLFDPTTGLILGAQCTGEAGVEKRIDVLSTSIQAQVTVFDLEEMELCYAPQYGAAKDALNMAGFVAANVIRGDAPIVHWDSVFHGTNGKHEPTHLLLDVREVSEVKAESVPHAINVPLPELRRKVAELPRDMPVDVFCRVGLRGYMATRILRQHGIDARNVSGGLLTYRGFRAASALTGGH